MAKNRDFSKFPNAITVLDNGNVGIGTSNPSSTLHISKGGVTFQVTDTNKSTSNTFSIYGYSQTSWAIATGNSGTFNGSEKIIIDDNGNIGIATASVNVETSAINLIVKGITGRTTAYIQTISGDGICGVSLYSGASTADHPSIIYSNDLRFGKGTNATSLSYVENMRLTNAGSLIVGPNGAASTAKITSYLGTAAISGTNDGFRMQVYSYNNASRNTIAWGQDSQNLTLARFGLEWNSGTSQMNFVWRDMYNASSGTTENMRLTGAGHLQVPNQPAFKYGMGNATITSPTRFGTDFGMTVKTDRDAVDSPHFNKATGRFTAPVAGNYIFGCTIMRTGTGGSGPIDFWITKNASSLTARTLTYGRGYAGGYNTDYQQFTIVTTIKLAVNDYVTLGFGGNLTIYDDDSWFYGYLLG